MRLVYFYPLMPVICRRVRLCVSLISVSGMAETLHIVSGSAINNYQSARLRPMR